MRQEQGGICPVRIGKSALLHKEQRCLPYSLREVVPHPDYRRELGFEPAGKGGCVFIREQVSDLNNFTCAPSMGLLYEGRMGKDPRHLLCGGNGEDAVLQ